MIDERRKSDVVIIGAGPMGMASAVRLLSRNISFTIMERGATVGSNILEWGHVHFFSNWKECVDMKSYELLSGSSPPKYALDGFPSGSEFVKEYLQPLGNLDLLKRNIQFKSEVVNVKFNDAKQDFLVTYNQDGEGKSIQSKVVIDASGTWGNNNSLIDEISTDIYPHLSTIPSPSYIADHFQDCKVAIVGNGHSAMNSIVLISQYSDAEINWIIRSNSPNFGKSKVAGQSKELENKVSSLLKQRQIILHNNFLVNKLTQHENKVEVYSEKGNLLQGFDYVVENIGANADYSFLKHIDINVDAKFNVPVNLASKIDPKLHTCSSLKYSFQDTVISDVDYYVVGMKSFGRASNFLLSYGYNMLDELVDHIA